MIHDLWRFAKIEKKRLKRKIVEEKLRKKAWKRYIAKKVLEKWEWKKTQERKIVKDYERNIEKQIETEQLKEKYCM